MLTELIQRLESASEGSRELDALCAYHATALDHEERAFRHWVKTALDRNQPVEDWICLTEEDAWLPPYTTSLDAALTLIPSNWRVFLERLPVDSGPCWSAHTRPHAQDGGQAAWYESPALALAIAALKARTALSDAGTDRGRQ